MHPIDVPMKARWMQETSPMHSFTGDSVGIVPLRSGSPSRSTKMAPKFDHVLLSEGLGYHLWLKAHEPQPKPG